MQDIIIEKPYRFVPPHRGTGWSSFIQRFGLHAIWLRANQGVKSYEVRNVERLKVSLKAGHGIMLAPNHCRYSDPLVLGWLAREARCHVYAMASWHLFHQGWFNTWAMRVMGGFSVYREGVDRQAINTAIEILETAERPLIVFPEGAVTRTNDRLHALLDGVAFIARTAAKRRAKRDGGDVVIHPVALKYRYQGNLDRAVDGVLAEIEQRLSWRSQRQRNTDQRVVRVGLALLALKEIEFFNRTYDDPLETRLQRLIDRLLGPLEAEWLGREQSGPVVPRVKALRMQIMPDMVQGNLEPAERNRRWEHLADIYLAQQISCYPPDYLRGNASVDRLLETVERFEEDLTDKVRRHGQLHVIIDVGHPIKIPLTRDRNRGSDAVMQQLEHDLQAMLDQLAQESPNYQATPRESLEP